MKSRNKQTKRFLIAPTEIAGIGANLKKYFKELGVEVDYITYNKHPFSYSVDKCLNFSEKSTLVKIVMVINNFIKSIVSYNYFFFMFGQSLLPYNLDLPILKLLGKKTGMIFLGCDIRVRELTLKEKHKYCVCKNCQEECVLGIKKKKVEWIQKYVNIIFSQPECSQLISREYQYIPVPINLSYWKVNFIKNDIPKIVHAPSHRQKKGTKYILEAIDRLKHDGYKFEFILLENLSNKKVKKVIENCDIVIDQVLMGWHGTFSLEAMASGKPVLCYIRKDLKKYLYETPIISTDPDNIYDNLKFLVENPNLCLELGRKGRQYVEKYHDAKKFAAEIIKAYEKIR